MDSSRWSALPRVVRWAVVGVAFVAGVAATALAMAIGLWPTGCRGGCHLHRAHLTVQATRNAVDQFTIDRGRCPVTVRELVVEGYLDTALARDPWRQELRISCTMSAGDDDVTVISAGPDRIFGTADDIVESP